MLKKMSSIILTLILLFDIIYASEVDLESERFILYNLNDNQVLMSEKENEEVSIASLTKIMTVIVSIEKINDFNDKVIITDEMIDNIEWDVSKIGFKEGEEYTYNDLLYGSILASGADAVNALAISTYGSYDKFINAMNEKAASLNMNHTRYSNVVGLYDENNYSSAYDQAKLLMYALNNDKFKEVFETKQYTLTSGKKIKSTMESYNTKNNDDISYILGSKTGYINDAGYCLASIASLNGVNYLFISLNAYSDDYTVHIKDHIKTYNYFNDNYGYKDLVNFDDIVGSINVKYSIEKKYDIKSPINIQKYLKNDYDKSKVSIEYIGKDNITYFTKKGTNLGIIKVSYDNNPLAYFDVIYNDGLTFDSFEYVRENGIYIIVSILVILLIVGVKKEV